jgi:hypothetical protein
MAKKSEAPDHCMVILHREKICVDLFYQMRTEGDYFYARTGAKPGHLFAERFRQVWSRLSVKVRRTLIHYWQKVPGPFSPWLVIELTTSRMENKEAACAEHGRLLKFMPWFDFPPLPAQSGEELLNTIAHELAHAYLYATTERPDKSYNAFEHETIRVAESWGFPQRPFTGRRMTEADRWYVAHLKKTDPGLTSPRALENLDFRGIDPKKARRWKAQA